MLSLCWGIVGEGTGSRGVGDAGNSVAAEMVVWLDIVALGWRLIVGDGLGGCWREDGMMLRRRDGEV